MVVGVVGEVMPVTISLPVEVLLTVTAVLSLSTSVGKGTEELEATEDASLCKRREEIERPINKMTLYRFFDIQHLIFKLLAIPMQSLDTSSAITVSSAFRRPFISLDTDALLPCFSFH